MKNSELHSFPEVRLMVLLAFYDFCRDMSMEGDKSLGDMVGYVAYDYENVFDEPVEELMLNVALLILSGNWSKENFAAIKKFVIRRFEALLSRRQLEALLPDESKCLIYDMEVLSLLEASPSVQSVQNLV